MVRAAEVHVGVLCSCRAYLWPHGFIPRVLPVVSFSHGMFGLENVLNIYSDVAMLVCCVMVLFSEKQKLQVLFLPLIRCIKVIINN